MIQNEKYESKWLHIIYDVFERGIKLWDNYSLQFYANIISAILLKKIEGKNMKL